MNRLAEIRARVDYLAAELAAAHRRAEAAEAALKRGDAVIQETLANWIKDRERAKAAEADADRLAEDLDFASTVVENPLTAEQFLTTLTAHWDAVALRQS